MAKENKTDKEKRLAEKKKVLQDPQWYVDRGLPVFFGESAPPACDPERK